MYSMPRPWSMWAECTALWAGLEQAPVCGKWQTEELGLTTPLCHHKTCLLKKGDSESVVTVELDAQLFFFFFFKGTQFHTQIPSVIDIHLTKTCFRRHGF